jgi:phosphoglycolate phosphatase
MQAIFGPLRAAILDLDGTLVDTLGDISAAVNRMLAGLGLPAIDQGGVVDLIGKGSEHLVRAALAQVGAPAQLYQRAFDDYQAAYGAVNGRSAAVYPGAAEGLRQLRAAGLRLACVTNKPGEFARTLLQAKGLAGFFDAVFGGDAFERKKPDPLPLRKACEALGAEPAQTLVLGDSRNDAQAARAAGCPVVLVTYGYNHGEPVRAVDADGYVDSLAEVAALLPLRRR